MLAGSKNSDKVSKSFLPLYDAKSSSKDIQSQEVTIRSYQNSDRALVLEIVKNGLLEFATDAKEKNSTQEYINTALVRDLDKIEKESKKPQYNRRFWVAEVDGRVVGCVGIKPTMLKKLGDKTNVTLYNLSVNKEQRRNGIGGKLMQVVESYCQDQKIQNIRLTTQSNLKPALGFYKAQGYKQTQKKKWKNLDLIYFEKEMLLNSEKKKKVKCK